MSITCSDVAPAIATSTFDQLRSNPDTLRIRSNANVVDTAAGTEEQKREGSSAKVMASTLGSGVASMRANSYSLLTGMGGRSSYIK